mgnify:CR=1 FL=1
MVELKKKKRKRKVKPRAGQIISQKVVVNVGNKGYSTKRRTGTQAKRSTQPQQVIYQNSPIPLQPNYSAQINDLRDEVVRHLSGVDKEAGRRRALDLRVEKKIAKQEGMQGTDVQTERVVGGLMEEMIGKLELEELTEQIEKQTARTAEIASGKITKKKGRPVMSPEEKAARKESREFAKRESMKTPVVGIPIPEAVQQVAELKPREFQEGSLLADMEGAVRIPQASKLKKRVLYKTYDVADPQDPQEDPSFV